MTEHKYSKGAARCGFCVRHGQVFKELGEDGCRDCYILNIHLSVKAVEGIMRRHRMRHSAADHKEATPNEKE